MKDSSQKKIPLEEGFRWITLSTIIVFGSALLFFFYYQYVKGKYTDDASYNIVAIVQTTFNKEPLRNSYLAELLELSNDKPTNLYRFNTKEAQKKLLAHPLITQATVKKIRPGTIYIDYTLREPMAFLADYTNTAVDREGFLFPFLPFFTPKRLPEIVLGHTIDHPIWGKRLQNDSSRLALGILHFLQEKCGSQTLVKRVDVSKAFAESSGQKQIVVILEDRINREWQGKPVIYAFVRTLRLDVDNYAAAFDNYLKWRSKSLENEFTAPMEGQSIVVLPPQTIDLRLAGMAFIDFNTR